MEKTYGKVVIGFPGVGKTSVIRQYHDSEFIDLEASSFDIEQSDGTKKKDDKWYVPYCKIACNLADQGHTVFVSSHREVQDYLSQIRTQYNCKICVVYPKKELKEMWLNRLMTRYGYTHNEKNERALKFIQDKYDKFVDEIEENANKYRFSKIIIKNNNYDLSILIRSQVG